ncbi:MAG: glycosyltransferase [Holophagaceae bacterium]
MDGVEHTQLGSEEDRSEDLQTPIRFLFVCTARVVSGLEIVTLNLMRRLKDLGHQVHCLTHEWADPGFTHQLEESGIAYSTFDLGWIFLRHPIWTVHGLKALPGAMRVFESVCREFQPDAVVHSVYHSIVMLSAVRSQLTVLHAHDAHVPSLKHRFIYALVNRRIGLAIAPSQFVAGALRSLGLSSRKICVVHNGVPVPAHEHAGPAQGDEARIAIVGQVGAGKGHSTLLHAFSALVDAGCQARLLIFGSGSRESRHALEVQIQELGLQGLVDWKGFVPNHEEIYAQADIVVVPSLRPEAFGLTALESGIRGIPVVAAGHGGLAETIIDGRTGLLFAPGSAEDLAQKLKTLILDPSLRREIGAAAREHALAKFTDRIMVARFVESVRTRLTRMS